MAQTTTTTLDVAEQVARDINEPAAGWEWLIKSFVCSDRLLLDWAAADLQQLQIGVVAISEDDQRDSQFGGSRDLVARTHVVQVAFQKTFASDAELKPLAAMVFQVKDYWMTKRRKFTNPDFAGFWVSAAKVRAATTPKAEMEKMMWAGLLELTFQDRTSL